MAFSVLVGAPLVGCGDDESVPGNDAGMSEDGGPGRDASSGDRDAASSGDDGGEGDSLTGVAAVGAPIAGGDVLARCADGESYEGTTDDDGAFQIAIPDASYPCALAVSGGDLTAAISALHSLAQSAGTTNITPLTELILARALAMSTGQTPAEWFAMPDEFDDVIAQLSASTDALRAALASAGYELPSTWGEGSAAPLSTPFVADPSDDAFDQLLEALGDALSAGGGDYASLTSDFVSGAALPEPTTTSSTTELAATVHASLVGSYELVFAQGGGAGCGSSCSYVDAQTVNVTVNADGTLVVAGTTLDDPFKRKVGTVVYDTEIVWRSGDLEYALSDNASGAFNEINLGDRSQSTNGFPKFLGQLRQNDSADLTLVSAHQGQYSRTHQYMGPSVAWTGLTIGSNGSITFTGGAGPNVAVADVVSVTDRLSCCGRIEIAVNLDIDGSVAIDNSDRLNLYLNAEGALGSIEYPTSSGDSAGARLDSSTLPMHDETSVPTESRMAATANVVGGSDVPLDIEIHSTSSGSPVFHNLSLAADVIEEIVLQQRILLRLEASSTLTQGQSFDCYEKNADGDTTQLVVKTAAGNAYDYSSEYGGRCRITLTTVQGDQGAFTLIEGTFTGELFNFKRSNPKLTIDDGVFRWVPAAP